MRILFIEGSDYTGKTTVIEELGKHLIKKNKRVLTLKEPSGKFRDMLLGNENIVGDSRRLMFAENHLLILEEIYDKKDNYDYIIVDRCACVSDFIYSNADSINNGYVNSINSTLKNYKRVDQKLFNNFFAENSTLILLEIGVDEFLKRVMKRKSVKNDINDNKKLEFKLLIHSLYSSFGDLISRSVLKRITCLFSKVVILRDDEFLKKIELEIGEHDVV